MDKYSYVYDYNAVAEKYIKDGKLDKGIAVYKKRIADSEKEIKRYKNYKIRREVFQTTLRNDCGKLGQILLENKLYDQATFYFLKMFPDVRTFRYIGEVYLEENNLEEASKAFKIAISQDFKNFDEICLLYQNKIEKSDDAIYDIYLSILYYNAYKVTFTKKYLSECLSRLKELLKNNPDDWLILKYLGLVSVTRNDDKRAAVYLSQALNSNPNDYISYFYLERCDTKKLGFDPFEEFDVTHKPIVKPFMSAKYLGKFRNFWGNYTKKYTFNLSSDKLSGVIMAKSTKVFGIGAIISIRIGDEMIFRYIDSNTYAPCEFDFDNLQLGKTTFSISMMNDLRVDSKVINEDRNLYIDNIYRLVDSATK